MREYRAKTLIKALSDLKVNTAVGIATQRGANDDWTVMIQPHQPFNVFIVSFAAHLRGFAMVYDGEGAFHFKDTLPDFLPNVTADDRRDVDGTVVEDPPPAWRSSGFKFEFRDRGWADRDTMRTQARTGGEQADRPEGSRR